MAEHRSDGSILNDVKKVLGLDKDYQAFDQDIILFINSTMGILRQVGFGPKDGFRITGSEETWTDYYGDIVKYEFVKDYIYCKVRVQFDPPQNSFGLDALNKQIDELLWRINFEFELEQSPDLKDDDDDSDDRD